MLIKTDFYPEFGKVEEKSTILIKNVGHGEEVQCKLLFYEKNIPHV